MYVENSLCFYSSLLKEKDKPSKFIIRSLSANKLAGVNAVRALTLGIFQVSSARGVGRILK
jgi:hypothetical protein